jgi:tetratricopeptide (TPR) repeat protein
MLKNSMHRVIFGKPHEVLHGLAQDNGAVALPSRLCYCRLGDAKAAADALEKAVVADRTDSQYRPWLGQAHGLRAEQSSLFVAARLATKARRSFEAAVQLDPHNPEAGADPCEYYLDAPGILGGGTQKASELAERVRGLDEAEYHFDQARLTEKRRQPRLAELHYRQAAELAPSDPSRLIDLAEFLDAEGRRTESDSIFERASHVAPHQVKVWFAQAKAWARSRRNLESAIRRYLSSRLAPDGPLATKQKDSWFNWKGDKVDD